MLVLIQQCNRIFTLRIIFPHVHTHPDFSVWTKSKYADGKIKVVNCNEVDLWKSGKCNNILELEDIFL